MTDRRAPVVVESATPIGPGFRVQNGDVIDMIVAKLLVVDDTAGPHSKGFGDVDLFAVDVHEPPQTPGTMLNTPWGMVEVLPVDHPRAAKETGLWRKAGHQLRGNEPQLSCSPSEYPDGSDSID